MDRNKTSAAGDGIMEEAVSWFLRIQEGFSQADFVQWRRWLAKEEAHAEAFDAISIFWREADQLEDLPWPGEQGLAGDEYDGLEALSLTAKSVRRIPARHSARRWWFATAASIAAVAMISFALVQKPEQDSGNYRTGTAEHRTISLEDGSSIILGAKSAVVIAYSRSVRHVELRSGEAFFKVAKDKSRPFVVAAGSRTVRALGTEFDVNIGVRDIKVAVVEGRVRVEGPLLTGADSTAPAGVGAISNLSAGDVLDFNADGEIMLVSKVDPILTTSWLDRRLAYVGATLESVIADVNRYSETELIIGDESTRQLIFTGTIFSDDIDNWLAGLETVFPVRLVTLEGHGILLIQSTL